MRGLKLLIELMATLLVTKQQLARLPTAAAGLKLLVYEALAYSWFRPSATTGLKLLVYEALSY